MERDRDSEREIEIVREIRKETWPLAERERERELLHLWKFHPPIRIR